MIAESLLLSLVLLLSGVAAALLAGRRVQLSAGIAVVATLAAAIPGVYCALALLTGAPAASLLLPWPLPGAALAFSVDSLSAVFLLPVFILSPVCALYGSAYFKGSQGQRIMGAHWAFYLGLVAAMVVVLSAAHIFLFLVAWELMSLTSFFLVAFDHQFEEVRRAAWLYLLASHLGVTVLLGFFLFVGELSGSLYFADFQLLKMVSPLLALGLFLAALGGFGLKAGLFPLHVWLPEAHPAAPSHVSALMSAVMVKLGIYGVLRVLTWLPAAPAWWGLLLAGLGITGALYGIALALLQRDIKRCLAYSTIENVGIIFTGLGVGIYASASGLPTVALLAFAGALLHLWNHALFKGLLFLGAGNLLHATGTRDMNLLGGLMKRLPGTSLLVMGGSMAIIALPPLNGFISEWLIYLGLLRGGMELFQIAGLPLLLLAGLLAVVGALALLVFVRLVGISLLGSPRSAAAQSAHEGGFLLLAAPALLLFGCLFIGLFPRPVLDLLMAPLTLLTGGDSLAVSLPASLSSLGVLGLVLLALIAAAALLLHRLGRNRPRASAPTWGCGFAQPGIRMTYSAEGFGELAHQHLLPQLLHPVVQGVAAAPLFPPPGQVSQQAPDPVLSRLLQPAFSELAHLCQQLRWLQQGRLAIYLLYIFLTSIGLMLWSLLVFGGG